MKYKKIVFCALSAVMFSALLTGCGLADRALARVRQETAAYAQKSDREQAEHILGFSLPENISIQSENDYMPIINDGEELLTIAIPAGDEDFLQNIGAWSALPYPDEMHTFLYGGENTEYRDENGMLHIQIHSPQVGSMFQIPEDISAGSYLLIDYYADEHSSFQAFADDNSDRDFSLCVFDSDTSTLYIYSFTM